MNKLPAPLDFGKQLWVPEGFEIAKLGPPGALARVKRHVDVSLAVIRAREEQETMRRHRERWPHIEMGRIRLITDVGREWDSGFVDIRDPWQLEGKSKLVLDSPATFSIRSQGWKFRTQIVASLNFETGEARVDTRSLVYLESKELVDPPFVEPPIDPFIWGYGLSFFKSYLNRK